MVAASGVAIDAAAAHGIDRRHAAAGEAKTSADAAFALQELYIALAMLSGALDAKWQRLFYR